MVRVSVVLPVHNKRELAIEALDSILNQSFRDFEIVISDDGSTDGTPLAIFDHLGAEQRAIKILSRLNPSALQPFSHVFYHDDIRIQYHYCANRGLSAARNRGIRHARGTFISFLEAECLWEPLHLETLVAFFEANPWAHICYVGERQTKENARPRKPVKSTHSTGWIFDQALASAPVSISSAMVHRSCFSECGGFDENMPACEDYDLWLRLTARNPVYNLEGQVEVMRRSPRAESGSRSWTWERFRVYALEKSFQSGHLDADQRLQVAAEIVRKCERLVEGLRRQGSEERANFYERKRRRFAQEVRKLRSSKSAGVPS
ncbi:MAG: glycosyltransferase family A protein [Candidatus Eisenbacteria bacterium]